jgi:serine/threonine protein kinase
MKKLLQINQMVKAEFSALEGTVESFIGGGGQGEVYRISIGGKQQALKWYFPHTATQEQRDGLEILIKKGTPTGKFLWPLDLAAAQGTGGFGYIMPLREQKYRGLAELLRGRVTTSLFACTNISLQLADSFFQLHAMGLCYKDISYNNVFFDPGNGDVLICDNDNVGVDGGPTNICGTPGFMAPEIMRREKRPRSSTDLYSLAVLLFLIFMRGHPLEGRKEEKFQIFDQDAQLKIYGTEPVFIFDPGDDSNRPIPGVPNHENARKNWEVFPLFIRRLFEQSFTSGKVPSCRSCRKTLVLPCRIQIGRSTLMLNYDTRIYPHHIDGDRMYDLSEAVAAVNQHPRDPGIWGLKNLTKERWTVTTPDGKIEVVDPGRNVTLRTGTKINFGKKVGEILQ